VRTCIGHQSDNRQNKNMPLWVIDTKDLSLPEISAQMQRKSYSHNGKNPCIAGKSSLNIRPYLKNWGSLINCLNDNWFPSCIGPFLYVSPRGPSFECIGTLALRKRKEAGRAYPGVRLSASIERDFAFAVCVSPPVQGILYAQGTRHS